MHEVAGAAAGRMCMSSRCELRILSTELRRKPVVHRVVRIDWCSVSVCQWAGRHLQTQGDLPGGTVGGSAITAEATLSIQGHDLALNTTTMGCLTDGRQKWTNSFHKMSFGFSVSVIHGGLDDIVGV